MKHLTHWSLDDSICPFLCQWWCSLTDEPGNTALICNGTTDQKTCSLRGGNVRFMATNNKLSDEQLNKLIVHLKKTIPNFPDISKKAMSYDYEPGIKVISLTWNKGYNVSKDYGDYILDLNRKGQIIGVELLNFKIDDIPME